MLVSHDIQREFDIGRPVKFGERRWRALVKQGFLGEDICFEKTRALRECQFRIRVGGILFLC
jgi:hypothetical protein